MYTFGMAEVAVQFADSDKPQSLLSGKLLQALDTLALTGEARNARVEPVYPGETDPHFKGMFVVTFSGVPVRVVQKLRSVPGVVEAFEPPARNVSRVAAR